jgi:hypothetical protein
VPLQGFSVGYYQMSWGEKAGFNVSFGSESRSPLIANVGTQLTLSHLAVQAAIVAGATILVAILILTGARLRQLGGPLHHSAH